MAYVYAHYKADTHEIFYIGIGKSDDGNFKRANDIHKRNPLWKKIHKKHGMRIEIIYANISWDDALFLEKELISKYGRICNKDGVLANITIGGTGCIGYPMTDDIRRKISNALKGNMPKRFGANNSFFGKKHSKETRERLSQSLKNTDKNKGINNPNFGKPLSEERKENLRQKRLGKKHPQSVKDKISAGGKGIPKTESWKEKHRGKNCHFYGKNIKGEANPTSKKCIFISTGQVFGCLKTACEELNLSYDTQRIYLNPKHPRHKNRKFNWI